VVGDTGRWGGRARGCAGLRGCAVAQLRGGSARGRRWGRWVHAADGLFARRVGAVRW